MTVFVEKRQTSGNPIRIRYVRARHLNQSQNSKTNKTKNKDNFECTFSQSVGKNKTPKAWVIIIVVLPKGSMTFVWFHFHLPISRVFLMFNSCLRFRFGFVFFLALFVLLISLGFAWWYEKIESTFPSLIFPGEFHSKKKPAKKNIFQLHFVFSFETDTSNYRLFLKKESYNSN